MERGWKDKGRGLEGWKDDGRIRGGGGWMQSLTKFSKKVSKADGMTVKITTGRKLKNGKKTKKI